MRLRLWRRRLTISAPRMAIRSAIPWPLRWLAAAVVLGLSGAVALWAFEFGRDIAGFDRHSVQELTRLQEEVTRLNGELEKAQAVAHTAENQRITERTAQEMLVAQLKELQEDNRKLRRDLGFFEQLIPASGQGGLTIRGLQARRADASRLRWQVLLVQAAKNAAEFKGQMEIAYTGEKEGKAWSMIEPAERHPVLLKQSLRIEGMTLVPPGVVVKTMSVRLMQGEAVVLTQTAQVTKEP